MPGTSNGGVFLSTNNGANWTAVNTGLTSLAVRAIVAQGTNVFAGTAGGVFVSTNSGTSWSAANTGLNNTSILSLNLDTRDYLFAGTGGNGVWRRPYVELTAVKEIPGALPLRFELLQNYPNPFNPTTIIQFTLSGPGFTLLKVYDVLGREVATLVNQDMHSGRYEATFDASGFVSGIYYYRLQTGNFAQTKKMVLLQ